MMVLEEHLRRQMAFSRGTFGPGPRTEGVTDHIRKELVEVAEAIPGPARAREWVDVVILSLDGLTRELAATYPWVDVAGIAARLIENKQGQNEQRDWPDWRTADPTKAIEHRKDGDA